MVTERFFCEVLPGVVRWICGPSLDWLSVRARWIRSGDDERVWGGNGKTQNSLAVFIQAVYHEEKGHGLLCPEMNKKIISSVCFITENHFSQIWADKSFRVKRRREGACVCVENYKVCVYVCLHGRPPVYVLWARVFVHVSVCVTEQNRRHENADGYFRLGGSCLRKHD